MKPETAAAKFRAMNAESLIVSGQWIRLRSSFVGVPDRKRLRYRFQNGQQISLSPEAVALIPHKELRWFK